MRSTAATIATTGVDTVSISAGYNAATYSLLINDTGTNVSAVGLLAISSALTVTAGTFTLGNGGDVTGGTITLGTCGKFLNQGGTRAASATGARCSNVKCLPMLDPHSGGLAALLATVGALTRYAFRS